MVFPCISYKHIITSSSAQGGGGSFKNRKPIGELGLVFFGMVTMVAVVTRSSPHPQLLDVVWCSAAVAVVVVVVWWSCSCGVVQLV